METKILTEKMTLDELKEFVKGQYGDLVKGAVDIERGVVALGGEFHADANEKLLEDGSKQEHIWGFNILPGLPREKWLEFHSLINIRPAVGNRSQEVQSEATRKKMADVINPFIG